MVIFGVEQVIQDKNKCDALSLVVVVISGLLGLLTQSIWVALCLGVPLLLVINIIYYYCGEDYRARALRDQNRWDVWSRNLFSSRKSGTCFTCHGTGQVRKICRSCHGSGVYRPKCHRCSGTGRVYQRSVASGEQNLTSRGCPKCAGSGLAKLPCKRCAEKGGATVVCFKCGGSGIHYF